MSVPESERIRIVCGVLDRYRELLDVGEGESTVAIARTLLASCPKLTAPVDFRSVAVEACQVLARANVRVDSTRYLAKVFRTGVTKSLEASARNASAAKARVDEDDRASRYDPSHDLSEMAKLEADMLAAERAAVDRARAALPAPLAAKVCERAVATIGTRPDFSMPSLLVRPPPRPNAPPRPAWYPPRRPVLVDSSPERGAMIDGELHTIGDVLGERVELMAEVERDEREGR